MKSFSQSVCEKIDHYVYVLKNPINSTVFYVGKGKNNRVFQHVEGALVNPVDSDKIDLIKNIHSIGKEVEHYLLRHGLKEEQAFEIESACIDLLGLENLTNVVKGHNTWERGLKTIDEVIQHYDAKVITITEPAIIININKLYKRFMLEDELYQATRSAWVVALHRRNTAEYAIAAYRGLVREVYKIKSWNRNSHGDRWEFVKEEVIEPEVRDKYLNQSLQKYIKKGNQNPIKYTY